VIDSALGRVDGAKCRTALLGRVNVCFVFRLVRPLVFGIWVVIKVFDRVLPFICLVVELQLLELTASRVVAQAAQYSA
jgi:hypothetical protein